MFKKLFNKTIDKFINLTDTVTTTDSLNIIARDTNGNTKAIRDVADDHELAADFNDGKVDEKYTVKQKPKRTLSKQEQEIRVANRFLTAFNNKTGRKFIVAQEQPETDSHIDVIVVETDTNEEIALQIRVSDDEPWRELGKNKYFERHGTGFDKHHDATKRAIESKLKYPVELRQETILLLDGWLGVRVEDLQHFIETEMEFLESTRYKEIWFVGGLPETTVNLYRR